MQSKQEPNEIKAVPDVPSPLIIGVTRARVHAHEGVPKELGTSGMIDVPILALDLGSTTGWAVRLTDGTIVSGTMAFRPGRYEGGGMRYLRFRSWLDEVARCHGSAVVYFEEVRAHAGTDAAHIYGGFLAHLSAWCEQRGIPYQGVPVATIKRHVTGKGNAGKEAVIAAVRARGHQPVDDNEADAIAILLWAIDTAGGSR